MEDIIPRSNMYKWVAISGVAVIIVTLVFAVDQLYKIDNQILDEEERIAVMQARLEAGKSAGNNPGNNVDNNAEGETPHSSLQQELDQIRLEAARKKLDVLENRHLELRQWATILFTVGVAVAAFGFTRWYRKIQMPMERIAQHEAEQYVTKADTDRA